MKVQRYRKFVNTNTYVPSMLGYVACGMSDVESARKLQFMDRSPLNVLEWHVLWQFMDKYVKFYGNARPRPNDEHRTFFAEFDDMFDALCRSYYYKTFRWWLTVIALVDSNTNRCDQRRGIR